MPLEKSKADCRAIVRLMQRIPSESALFSLINPKTGSVLQPNAAAPALTALLDAMPEKRWRERVVATIALRYVTIAPQSESAAALALCKASRSDMMRRIATANIPAVTCLLSGMAALLASAILYNTTGWLLITGAILLATGAFLFLASPFIFFTLMLRNAARNTNVRFAAVETLARLQLPGSAGALAKASRGNKRLANVTRQALIQLLPTLTEAHYGQLPGDVTPELCALLLDSETPEHLIALTAEALGKVGDGRAVEPMQKFALLAPTPQLRGLAENALPILMARREQENASSTLLRHSSAPPIDAGLLLRAASGSAVTPPEQLLRPSAGTNAAPDALE